MQDTLVQPLGQEDPLGEGNGNPLQYSCLENPMDGGAWWAIIHGVAESDTTERLLLTTLIGPHLKVELLSRVRLSDCMDCNPPGSSVRGIFQARGLE